MNFGTSQTRPCLYLGIYTSRIIQSCIIIVAGTGSRNVTVVARECVCVVDTYMYSLVCVVRGCE